LTQLLRPAALIGPVAALRHQSLQSHVAGGAKQIRSDLALLERRNEDTVRPARQQAGDVGLAQGQRQLRENHVAKQQRIGERLTRAMAKAHMDRRELAALTGYSEAQIVSWERGRAELYPTDLITLCHALDVKPEWLLCWERRLY